MRILMLLPRFPYPPERGDTLRSWAALTGLARRHEVWLACVDGAVPWPAHLARVQQHCREVAVFARPRWRSLCRGAWSLLRGRSVTAGCFGDGRLAETLQDWSRVRPFDVVLTYSSAMAPAAEQAVAPRRVLDLGDVDSTKWAAYAGRCRGPRRWLYALESRRVAALEARAAALHDVVLVVNERERQKLLVRWPGVCSGVVPTTVDLDFWRPRGRSAGGHGPPRPPAAPRIGMLGSMFYPPNVRAVDWFGQEVWARVQARLPGARWLIIGNRPSRRVRRWGRRPGVLVTGYVPDVRPVLESLRVFISAVDGDLGVQSKLIVALAAGRPAVVTPETAAGLDCAGPQPFLVADSPEAFAAAIVRLAMDGDLWCELSTRARAIAEERFGLTRQAEMLERWLQPEGAFPEDATSSRSARGRGTGFVPDPPERRPSPGCEARPVVSGLRFEAAEEGSPE